MINSVKRNYLEINSITDLNEEIKPFDKLTVNLDDSADFQLNKFFYKEIGKEHQWIDRLA